MTRWLKRVAVSTVLVTAVVFLWRVVLIGAAAVALFVTSIAALIIAIYLLDQWSKWSAMRRFRVEHPGKDLLIVYSNSPHWQRYIEEGWLPRWRSRAVVLNWSERKTWDGSRPEVQLFRAHAGDYEFNPLAIVVPPTGRRAHIVRFWRAFRDAKHGKDRLLRRAEANLDAYLASTSDGQHGADREP